MTDLEKAKLTLRSDEYTCVLQKGDLTYTSKERGVKPLVSLLEAQTDLCGFSAADKVIGKGAAFLYVRMKIKCVYAHVISTPALELLLSHGIHVEYTTLTDRIINRKGDGLCPFEALVLGIDDTETAYTAIRQKLKELQKT